MKLIINGESVDIGGGGSGGTIEWENINGRPDLSSVSSMIVAPIVLNSIGWVSGQQTVTVEGVLVDEKAQLIIPVPTYTSKVLYISSGIEAISHSENTIVFKASTIPSEDVDVLIYIIGVAEIKNLNVGTFEWWSPHMASDNTPAPYMCSASSNATNFGSSGIYAAFDGNRDTYWANGISDNNRWIQFDFGEKAKIFGIKMLSRNDGAYTQLPVTFSILISDDGEAWESVYQETNSSQIANKDEEKTISFDRPYNCRYIKIDGMASTWKDGSIYVGIGDIQFNKLIISGGTA